MKNKTILFIVLAVVLVIAIGLFFIFGFGAKKVDNNIYNGLMTSAPNLPASGEWCISDKPMQVANLNFSVIPMKIVYNEGKYCVVLGKDTNIYWVDVNGVAKYIADSKNWTKISIYGTN